MTICQLHCSLHIHYLDLQCKEELSILSHSLAYCIYVCTSMYIHSSIHQYQDALMEVCFFPMVCFTIVLIYFDV